MSEINKLVCLMHRYYDKDCISYILLEDDEYIDHWKKLESSFGTEMYWIRPFRDGDVSISNGNQILFGLQILYKYNVNLELHSEHDQLWAGGKDSTCEEMKEIMSEEDIKRMEELGWFENEDSWSFST